MGIPLSPSQIFFRVSFSHNHLLPLNCSAVVVVLFFKFIFLELSIYTKISLTVFFFLFFFSLLQTGATRYRASREGLSDGGPTLRLSCRLRGRLQA